MVQWVKHLLNKQEAVRLEAPGHRKLDAAAAHLQSQSVPVAGGDPQHIRAEP